MAGAVEVVAEAVARSMRDMTRSDGREIKQGPHEVREVAPALADALALTVPSLNVQCERRTNIHGWTRPTTDVDVAATPPGSDAPAIAIETKVWDIGHQLFDLAKIACLLASGVSYGFLLCVAHRPADFDRKPGGVLFPPTNGVSGSHGFENLISTYHDEWSAHVGRGGPEPTSLPTEVRTTAILDEVSVAAYPGHAARAVEVVITDGHPVPLSAGWPRRV